MQKEIMCFECGEETCELRKVTRRYEGDGYAFDMEVTVPFCKECGAPIDVEEIEEEITKEANERIRKIKGIITKEEILSILETYNVSQKFLSRLLGWGEITLTRYITGNYTPNRENSEQLKQLKNPYIFLSLLEKKIEESHGQLKKEAGYRKSIVRVNDEIQKNEKRKGKIFAIANWYLEQGGPDEPITNLALQKSLYFTQNWSKVFLGKRMFEDVSEAWAHGAVYPDVYHTFKTFRYDPLPVVDVDINLEDNEIEILKFVKRNYLDIYNAKALEHICHSEIPYKLARKGCQENTRCREKIKHKDTEAYYSAIAKQYGITLENDSGVRKYLFSLI